VIFILFWIGGFWADAGSKDNTQNTVPTAPPAAPRPGFGISIIAALLAANLAVTALKAQQGALPTDAVLELPARAANWQRSATLTTAPTGNAWAPLFSNADLEASVSYARGNETVTLDVGYFHTQRDGAEAVSSLNRLSNPYGGEWNLIASRPYAASKGSVNESELNRGNDKVLVWSGYLMGDRFTANPYIAKVYQAEGLLRGQQHAAFVTLSTPFDAPLPQLQARLDAAWSALAKPLGDAILTLSSDG
jgi:EpsI family protein